jgi:hypothetical protein
MAGGGNWAIETKKGWMVKGGKKEPSTRSLYILKGIKNADPPLRISGKGVDGWQRREGKPSIDLKKLQAELSLVGKKVRKKKCYALIVKL